MARNQGLTYKDLRNAILFAAVVYLALMFIRNIIDVILIFSIAALLVVSLSPFVTRMNKHGIPRWAGTVIVILVMFGIFSLILYFIVPAAIKQMESFAASIPFLSDKIQHWYTAAIHKYPFLADVSSKNINIGTIERFASPFVGGVGKVTQSAAYMIAAALVILVTTIYSLINPKPLVDGFLNLVEHEQRQRATAAGERLAIQIWAWARGTVFAMIAIFGLTWIAMWLLGFEQALLFGVIAGVLEIVPVVGPILAAIPPIVAALIRDPILALWVIVAFTAIQQFENHILIPMVMSRQVSLHPVTVIFSVLVMSAIFGLIGVFLATPAAVTAGVLYDEMFLCEYRGKCDIRSQEEKEDNEEAKHEGDTESQEE